MAMDTISVLIADDHPLFCEGLRMCLEQDELEVVGIANNGRRALEMTLALKPDVLLLDLRMPGLDGFQTLVAIRSAMPNADIIVLTSYPTSEYLERALLLGAAGFLSKEEDPKNIPQAVRVVASGDAIMNRDLLNASINGVGKYHFLSSPVRSPQIKSQGRTADIMDRGIEHQLPTLTTQEIRVIKLVASGLDNDTITKTLHVTRNTVKTHMRNIFSKLGVSDRTQAAIWAIRSGLADEKRHD